MHLFPATVAIFPAIAPLRWLGGRLLVRVPWLGRAAIAVHYLFATLCAITLTRVVPFLAPSDLWLSGAAAAAAMVATSRVVRMSPWLAAPLSLAVPLALFPPMPPDAVTRLAILAVSGAAMAVLLASIGARARSQASPLAWGFAVLTPALALRIVLFWLLPTAEPRPILERIPGLVDVVVRPAAHPTLGTRKGLFPINFDDLRLVVEGCEPDVRFVGTLHSLYRRRHGAWSRVGYPPGDRIEVDCARGVAWVPEMVKEKLWSVDLATLEIRKPYEACEPAGPTLVRFNQERTALYGFPGGDHLGRYDPDGDGCQVAVQGGVLVSYSVDEARGEAVVARNGSVEVCPLDGTQRCDRSIALTDPALPAWLQRGLFNRPFFVVHFNKLVQDPATHSVLATSIHSGRLYRLDREDLRIRESVFLERGIRWVNLDAARRRVFVGGFVRGTLFVLDADTLEVRAQVFLGRKIRYLEPTRDGHLLVAASTGALEIDIDALEASGSAPRPAALDGLERVPRVDELRRLPDAARYVPVPGGSVLDSNRE